MPQNEGRIRERAGDDDEGHYHEFIQVSQHLAPEFQGLVGKRFRSTKERDRALDEACNALTVARTNPLYLLRVDQALQEGE